MKLIRISAVWCTSCIVTHKAWQEIKNKYKDFSFEEYDYDEDEEIIKKYNIVTKIPAIIILDNEKEIGRIIGEKSKKEMIEIIENVRR